MMVTTPGGGKGVGRGGGKKYRMSVRFLIIFVSTSCSYRANFSRILSIDKKEVGSVEDTN